MRSIDKGVEGHFSMEFSEWASPDWSHAYDHYIVMKRRVEDLLKVPIMQARGSEDYRQELDGQKDELKHKFLALVEESNTMIRSMERNLAPEENFEKLENATNNVINIVMAVMKRIRKRFDDLTQRVTLDDICAETHRDLVAAGLAPSENTGSGQSNPASTAVTSTIGAGSQPTTTIVQTTTTTASQVSRLRPVVPQPNGKTSGANYVRTGAGAASASMPASNPPPGTPTIMIPPSSGTSSNFARSCPTSTNNPTASAAVTITSASQHRPISSAAVATALNDPAATWQAMHQAQAPHKLKTKIRELARYIKDAESNQYTLDQATTMYEHLRMYKISLDEANKESRAKLPANDQARQDWQDAYDQFEDEYKTYEYRLDQAVRAKKYQVDLRAAVRREIDRPYQPPHLVKNCKKPAEPEVLAITLQSPADDLIAGGCGDDGPDWDELVNEDPDIKRKFYQPEMQIKSRLKWDPDPEKFSGTDISKYRAWKEHVHEQIMLRVDTNWGQKVRKLKALLEGPALRSVEWMKADRNGFVGLVYTLEKDYGNYKDQLTALHSRLDFMETLDIDRPHTINQVKHLLRQLRAASRSGDPLISLESAVFSRLRNRMTPETKKKWLDHLELHCTERPRRATFKQFDEWADCLQERMKDEANFHAYGGRPAKKGRGAAVLATHDLDYASENTEVEACVTVASRMPHQSEDGYSHDCEEDDVSMFADARGNCFVCNKPEHFVAQCPVFTGATVDKRQALAQEKRLCFNCLGKGHPRQRCLRTALCTTCNRRGHHVLLHRDSLERRPREQQARTDAKSDQKPPSGPKPDRIRREDVLQALQKAVAALTQHADEEILAVETEVLDWCRSNGYLVLPARVSNPATGENTTINVAIDTLAGATLASEWLVDYLNLDTVSKKMKFNTVEPKATLMDVQVGMINLESIDGSYRQDNIPIKTVKIPEAIRPPPYDTLRKLFPRLRDLKLPRSAPRAGVDLIVGIDVPSAQFTAGDIHTEPWEPKIRQTPFGLGLMYHRSILENRGRRHKGAKVEVEVCQYVEDIEHLVITVEDDLHQKLERLWEFDSIGLQNAQTRQKWSKAETAAWRFVRDSMRQAEDGAYTVGVPWKPDAPQLPKNYKYVAAMQPRIEAMYRERGEGHKIDSTFEDWIERGFVHEVPSRSRDDGFYIPWFGVYKETSETTAFRVVLNGAKQYFGVSLNETMYPGPKLHSDLVDVLLNFRKYEHAVVADISKMYMKIKLAPEDRKFHRFIYKGQAYELSSWPFGNRAAPFVALYTVRQHVYKYGNPQLQEVMRTSSYVDDIMMSFKTVEEATTTWQDLNECLKKGAFNMCKFNSNSPEVLKYIPQDMRSRRVDVGQGNEDPRTLGQIWTGQAGDEFKFECPKDTGKRTKAEIASYAARLFDPLGFLDPVTTRGRLILQELHGDTHALKIGWNEDLSERPEPQFKILLKLWDDYVQELQDITEFRIPRILIPYPDQKQTIAILNDGSKRAMDSVAYMVNGDDKVHSNLIMSKRKLTPTRKPTIPKIELNAATNGARMSMKLRNTFPDATYDFSTDSSCALHWILRPTHKLNLYINSRVSEIFDLTHGSVWRHVPTALNTADLPTRGMRVQHFLRSQAWKHGPGYLCRPVDDWPNLPIILREEDQVDLDEAIDHERTALVCAVDDIEQDPEGLIYGHVTRPCVSYWGLPYQGAVDPTVQDWHPNQQWAARAALTRAAQMEELLKWDDISTWGRQFRNLYYFLVLRNRVRDEATTEHDLRWEAWVRLVGMYQVQMCKTNLEHYAKQGEWPRKSTEKKYDLGVDRSGLLRVGGRMTHQPSTQPGFRPIFLANLSKRVELIVKAVHDALGHNAGTHDRVANRLRLAFWGPGFLYKIQNFIRKCVPCQKIRRQFSSPPMQPYPSDMFTKFESAQPYEDVDLDVLGHFLIKRAGSRAQEKHYVLAAVCRYTKAVHYEPICGLTTDSLIMGLSRMTALRGAIVRVRSDNGTNFHGGRRAIREHQVELQACLRDIDWDRVQAQDQYTGIRGWSFTTPHAPWSNGLAEAAVKLAKHQLWQTFKHTTLDSEEFRTAVARAANIVNSRPVAGTVTADYEEGRVITPNHLLCGRLGSDVIPHVDKPCNLVKRHDQVQRLVQQFKQEWINKLLSQIHGQDKWQDFRNNIKAGQLVLIADGNLKRCYWPLGLVEEVERHTNGVAQKVRLRSTGTAPYETHVKKDLLKTSPTAPLTRSTRVLVPLDVFNDQYD